MNRINCLIVDDEPIAGDIILNYCSTYPALHVVATCLNAFEARRILGENVIDIIFLDIEMPVLDGIGFLHTLKNPPQIIFTTAYKEYAVTAFDLAACDYLVKPFSLERFIIAVDKAMERLSTPVQVALKSNSINDDYLFIKTDGKIHKINYDELLYAEANGNYTRIITLNASLAQNMAFLSMEALLPDTHFIRVHRSFIINKSKISHIEGNRVFIGKYEIPIGSNYKETFFKAIGL
ncbi:LytTR family two component transcriptional regulator [Chitinophaga niastensis]|uniref:LytTR family two component transcriptional regulator n=1 Tax=Chitinophaga niastensis TaxID=536980 RepID=A0A2P8HGT1_CHINA|nr:LytTR family DNA-binding domain-containing protein [Chitinophaga niastensis]PSL45427.1 LytTR family two component transcriptional regulator [Chitinophaga niastensis]